MTAATPARPAAAPPVDPLSAARTLAGEMFETFGASLEIWQAGQLDATALAQLQSQRLRALVAHAWAASPFYRRHWAGAADPERLARGEVTLDELPPVHRRDLMLAFDDWVTEPDLQRSTLEAFVHDRANIGVPWRGRYAVWTSSGTTAEPVLFVHDERSLAVTHALFALRASRDSATMQARVRLGDRFAYVAAVEGHFAGISMWSRLHRLQPWHLPNTRAFSALQPLPALVAALNAYAPRLLTSYPTMLALLASEQRAGRLRLQLAGAWSGGENLSPAERAGIAEAFGCPVVDDYGASEFPNLAWDCGHGVMHQNADWAILEPVDRHGAPVPPGVPSHTVLLTGLANHAQPLVRYDLGDSITVLPQRCPCGSSLPAIRVQGRCDDIVTMRPPQAEPVSLLPLALTTVIEDEAGVYRFQLLQQPDPVRPGEAPATGTGTRFVLRVQSEGEAHEAAWQRAAAALRQYAAVMGVQLELVDDGQPPAPSEVSGKLRRVCAA